MRTIERISSTLAREWWQKLLFFLLFASMNYILIYSPIENLIGYNYYLSPLLLLFLIFVPLFIIEQYTPYSRWWFIGIFFNKIEQKNILKAGVITIAGFAAIILTLIIAGSKVTLLSYWDTIGIIQIIYNIIIFAVIEELIFRGVILRYFNEKLGEISSILIVSFLFALIHILNPDITILAFVNIFLFSLLVSFVFLRTNSMTTAIMLHSIWNLFQALLLGWNVSGKNYYYSIAQFTRNDLPEMLSGGGFGLESSIIITITILLNGYYFHRFLKINPEFTSLIFKRDYTER